MNEISVSMGSSHTFVVDSDGVTWGFGCNTDYQLGTSAVSEVHKPTNHLRGKVAAASCGSHHTIIIDSQDKLWSVGNGGDGRLGNNSCSANIKPEQIEAISNAKAISAGWRHSAVIDRKDILWTFGCNNHGQLGTGDYFPRFNPTMIMEIDRAYQVSCGGKHTCVIDIFGNLWTFGDNFQGQLGVPDSEVHHKPVWVSQVPPCRFVSAGWEHTAVIDIYNNLWLFGSNEYGQLGLLKKSTAINQYSPTKVLSNIKTVACGGSHTLAVTFDGILYACGANNEGQCALEKPKNYSSFTKVEGLPAITTVAANQSSLAVDVTGKVWGFGANCYGELGSDLSQYNKYGSVIIQPPKVIEPLKMYLPFTRVKSARNILIR